MPVLMSLPKGKEKPTMANIQRGISDAVLKVLRDRYRNIEVSLDDLIADTGYTRQQVTMAISNLRRSCDITTPRRAWYVYHGPLKETGNGVGPNIVPLKSKAEVTALLADGRVLVTIEGVLYVATELVVE